MKTVLITGCSSGFGLETARYFLERDWQVIATMRTPREDVLPPSERLRVLALDVTDADSIRRAVDAAGPIDVLVNNAGIGMLGALEGTTMAMAREVFETNTLGTIAMTQAVLPQFRQRRAGVVINVTSSVTLEVAAAARRSTRRARRRSTRSPNRWRWSSSSSTCACAWCCRAARPRRASATTPARGCRQIPEAYAELAQKRVRGMQDSPPTSRGRSTWRRRCGARRPIRRRRCASPPAPTRWPCSRPERRWLRLAEYRIAAAIQLSRFFTSRIGGAPNRRRYSRLNCDWLS